MSEMGLRRCRTLQIPGRSVDGLKGLTGFPEAGSEQQNRLQWSHGRVCACEQAKQGPAAAATNRWMSLGRIACGFLIPLPYNLHKVFDWSSLSRRQRASCFPGARSCRQCATENNSHPVTTANSINSCNDPEHHFTIRPCFFAIRTIVCSASPTTRNPAWAALLFSCSWLRLCCAPQASAHS
jgi:hypothetical protein